MDPVSKGVFVPSSAPKALASEMKWSKVRLVAFSVLTLGVYYALHKGLDKLKVSLINQAFLPVIFMPKTRDLGNISIKTFDGALLSAKEVLANPKSDKWLVYFCGNGAKFEDLYDDQVELAQKLGVNLMMFNYRGVNGSQGELTDAMQLKIDGASVVEHLKQNRGVKEEDLLFYGWSMGGGVAATLMDYYPKAKIISERSYRSTAATAEAFAQSTVSGFKGKVVGKIVNGIVRVIGYQLNAIKAWKKVPDAQKLIIYHHQDGVINYHGASLYHADKVARKTLHKDWREKKTKNTHPGQYGLKEAHKPPRVKLKKDVKGQDAHTYQIDGNNQAEIVEGAKKLLK